MRLVRLDEERLGEAIRSEENILEVTPLSDNNVMVEQIEGDFKKTLQVGEVVKLPFAEFIIETNDDFEREKKDEEEAAEEENMSFRVKLLSVAAVANGLRGQLQASLANDNSTMINLAINNQEAVKAKMSWINWSLNTIKRP